MAPAAALWGCGGGGRRRRRAGTGKVKGCTKGGGEADEEDEEGPGPGGLEGQEGKDENWTHETSHRERIRETN